ncbi:MAG: TIGR04282 family arsenosugar biosynthesis glycosyltransferase [Rhodospirillaceae bacterium]|nr:TIGR04282 family arsenosugar biosynthesis glycosyltransferase [Rhodospirillaceae bacterium]MBL6930744.1 TIGR04282 family arsenosugar biosynthesis glycosyltransferase [Rhodospirillales bacterium]
MSGERHLVVFAREPVLGRVKGRLGRDIGVFAATRFYRQTLAIVLNRLSRNRRWRCWLALSPDSAIIRHRFWPKSFRPLKQGVGDIGERMKKAMAQMPPGPVVIIGTDVPDITGGHIKTAFKALGNHDVVFGPAADGGYWLVGARRTPATPDIFSGVRWSSQHTLQDSLTKLRKEGCKVALLETLNDIDDGAAFAKWSRSKNKCV